MDFLTNLNLNKNELQNAVIQNLSSAPSSPKVGQIYYNTSDQMTYQYKQTSAAGVTPVTYAWVTMGKQGTVTQVATGSGLTGGPITESGTISHADTSSQASITASSRTYINAVTLDDFGHVTALGTGTETVVDTDSYVNSASFANDDTNNNVKMTLTRTGTVTGSVTANIPKVSSSSAGVAPKGAAVSSQDQTTKFLREDGTWAAPSYTSVSDYVKKDGSVTMTGALNMGSHKITNVTDPSSAQDAATKNYVDKYKVGSATFADDSTSTPNSPVKLTIKDSQSTAANLATANIPKVSSSSAGVAPKGAAVSTQSQTTKFLREDGTWAAPSYTDPSGSYKPIQTAVDSPTASGNATAFIDTISQNENGVITATKKNVDFSAYLKKDGTVTMTGNLDLGSHKITNVTDPTSDQDAATKKYVDTAINNLPEPMVFKGTVGTGGTVEWASLPSASSSNEGWTYKVITAHATAVSSPSGNPKSKGYYELVNNRYILTEDTTVVGGKTYYTNATNVGDTIISNGSSWEVIPSGDEPAGTVTNVAVTNATNGGLSITGSPITSSGTITIGLDTGYGDTKNPYGSKTANYVLASPNGSAGVPTFRALVAADIPALGNIQNTGALQTTDITIANGDKLVVTDADNGNKIARTSTSFDGTTTSYYLSKKGTFEQPATTVANGENKPVTSGAVYSYIQGLVSGSVYKLVVDDQNNVPKNPALTASGGAFTWTISNGLGNPDVSVTIYRISDGAKVMPDITVGQSSPYDIVVTINDPEGAGSLAANTYKAVVMG